MALLLGSNRVIPATLLFIISFVGFFALLVFPIENGLFGEMILQAEQHIIGVNSSRYDPRLTRCSRLDDGFNSFTSFFYAIVEGSKADMSLLMIPFAGSAIGIWLLAMIESNRTGNKGRIPTL